MQRQFLQLQQLMPVPPLLILSIFGQHQLNYSIYHHGICQIISFYQRVMKIILLLFLDMNEALLNSSSRSSRVSIEMSLMSERSSYRGHNTTTLSSKTNRTNKVMTPNLKALKAIGDKSSQLPTKKIGLMRWLVDKYSSFEVLNPQSNSVLIWNIINFALICFFLAQIGFLIGFGQIFWQDELTYFYYGDILFILVFVADMMVSPLKGYYHNGILIENRVTIFKRYSRLYFHLDLLALIGLLIPYLGAKIINNPLISVYLNWFKILFCCKILIFYQLDKYIMMIIQNRWRKSHIYAISRIVFFMILWSHWMGVGFFAVDNWVLQTNLYGPNTPNHCWTYNSGLQNNISQTPWYIQYVYTLYYSVGNITTIAYGDITADNPAIAVYTIIISTMSVLLFTYFFKILIEVIFLAQTDQIQNQKNITLIRRYLKNNHVNTFLQAKIRSYFQINWKQERFRNRSIELQFIDTLPKQLKEQLNISLFGEFISDLGLIVHPKNISHAANRTPFVYQLANAFQFQRMTVGQVLYKEGEKFLEHSYVYYCDPSYGDLSVTLGQGRLAEEILKISTVIDINQESIDQIYLKTFKIASTCGMFGEVAFFSRGKRDHWAICNKNIELIKLRHCKLQELMSAKGSQLQKQRLAITVEDISTRMCSICKQKGHNFKKCHYCTYTPQIELILKKMKFKNERDNSEKILDIRQGEKAKTGKCNSWKMYTRQKKQIEGYLNKIKSEENWSNGESSGDDSFRQDVLDELMLLKSILNQHITDDHKQTEIQIEEYSQFDIDLFHSYVLYNSGNNMDMEVKKCNIVFKKKLEEKKKGLKST